MCARQAARYFALLVLYALAMMSKPMVVTLPVVLLLLDIWPLRRVGPGTWSRAIAEEVPLLALALATSAATVINAAAAAATRPGEIANNG